MIDVILLISGSSKRMGREKALLPFFENKNFVYQILETYLFLAEANVYIVVNPQNFAEIKLSVQKFEGRIKFIVNHNSNQGRIGSILLGLEQIREHNGVFIQNIDNPFVSYNLLTSMLKNYKPKSFLVPQFEGKNGHPLLLGAELVQEMKANRNSITDLKQYLNKKEKRFLITKDKAVLANINSPVEYQKWFPDIDL